MNSFKHPFYAVQIFRSNKIFFTMTHKVFCLNVKMKKRRTQVYVYKYVSITRKITSY